jgi:hypothetical protein
MGALTSIITHEQKTIFLENHCKIVLTLFLGWGQSMRGPEHSKQEIIPEPEMH